MIPRAKLFRLLSPVALFLCLSAPARLSAETISVGGTGGALGTMRIMVEEFKKEHPSVNIIIVPGLGSGGGRRALLGGALDITVITRAGNRQENTPGTVAVEFGKTPLVFATGNKNPVSDVTGRDLIEIYSGRKITWPSGERLRLVVRPEADSDTDVLKSISPAMEEAVKSALAREGMKMAITDSDSADAIESMPGGFGTSTLALILSEKRSLKALLLNGVAPSAKSITDGSYPLFKTFYVLTRTNSPEPARKFVAFVLSPRGREILLRLEYWVADSKRGR